VKTTDRQKKMRQHKSISNQFLENRRKCGLCRETDD
jgi:hypothetical protein